MTKYAGRTAVVAGAAHGVGLAVAKRLVEGGATVLAAVTEPADAPLLRAELGRTAHVLTGPDPTEVAARLGRVDHLFLHAGSADGVTAHTRAALDALLPLLAPGGSVVLSGCPATQPALRACAREATARRADGVRVNTVAAGHDDARMLRRGSADEAARAALFLALDAPFTTGTELPVDLPTPHTDGAPDHD
ncbi:short-chain dehydrogenase [Streptomyces sp. NPDC052225]|uniref:short-chain dehydrogenase n=1 Tax=Streptomyces sp. NPDC052225 TaxID=3154949 RepID=UPI00344351BF